MSILEITTQNQHEILSKNEYLIIMLYMDGCAYCKVFNPVFEKIADNLKSEGKIFCKTKEVWNIDFFKDYSSYSFPSVIVVKNGKEVLQQHGICNEIELIGKLNSI